MAILSSYYWSAFPFDNICPDEGTESYGGTWEVEFGNETLTTEVDGLYRFCLQDFFRYDTFSFPFVSQQQREGEEWMTAEQEEITNVYGWTTVGVLGIIIASFVWGWFGNFQSLFRGTYEAKGEDQGINFSEVPSISTYIPQVESPVFSYPLLACNIDGIDHELLDWTDPDRPDFVFYDLTRDAEVLLRGTDVSSKVVFSQVAHFPPGNENDKS